jgi:predicted TIM-barrel fold metal-dependent hydrolase
MTEVGSMDELPWVISVDDHVLEPAHVWTTWLPERFKARGPHIERDNCVTIQPTEGKKVSWKKGAEGPVVDWWVYEDLAAPMPQISACVGFPPEAMTTDAVNFTDVRPGCYEPVARLSDMDINRTERSMCFPTFPRFAGQTFLEAKDRELALACVKAYNDWMIEEWCGDSGGRLIPLGIIPLWDANLAAAEIRRNAARGCHAVAFTELPSYLGLPTVHDKDRYWDPFFQACAETGTVICMHIGSGSRLPNTSADAPNGVMLALTSLNAFMGMADWLLCGALARFPKLKIAFSESQIGWIPFLLERLDTLYVKSAAWADIDPSVTELPSSYVPGRVFGCFYDDMVGVDLRYHIGIEQLVFETDYPHQDSTWPDTPKLVAQIAERVTPEELEMLVRTNAIKMLDLDPADLKPTGVTA